MSTLIRGGTVVNHDHSQRADVLIDVGKIVAIGEKLADTAMDFEAAGRISGARFVVLKGGLARLHRALIQYMLDLHTGEHGYTDYPRRAA